jgi:hypothetical protein
MNDRLPRLTAVQASAARHAIRAGRRLLLVLALLPAWLPAASQPDGAELTEYRVKTAFLYNFARFVTWPVIPPGQFSLCVFGADPLDKQLDTLQNKTIHGRSLRVIHLNSLAMIDNCQLLFVSRSQTHKLHDVISTLREQPVLTVSDIDNFIESGGIIGFRLIDNKVRFDINTGAAKTAGLSISSKLLTLASTIRRGN